MWGWRWGCSEGDKCEGGGVRWDGEKSGGERNQGEWCWVPLCSASNSRGQSWILKG